MAADQITFGSKPSARSLHVATWSDAADGLYLQGGVEGVSGGARYVDELWFFSRQAGFKDRALARAYTVVVERFFLGLGKAIHADKLNIPAHVNA